MQRTEVEMSEVLKISLFKKDLPAYINDILGSANYGPSLKTQSNEVIVINGRQVTIDMLVARCNDDAEVNALTSELVDAVMKASPSKLIRVNRAGFLSKWWNSMTGRNDTKIIEFNLYCRRVEKLAKRGPILLEGMQSTISLINYLHDLYERDIQLLGFYIDAGYEFLDDMEKGQRILTESERFGLSRLRRKLINMKVTQGTLEMHRHTVKITLSESISNNERMHDCIHDLLPMWRHQVQMFKSGAYDITSSTELNAKFSALVNKINANTAKGNQA